MIAARRAGAAIDAGQVPVKPAVSTVTAAPPSMLMSKSSPAAAQTSPAPVGVGAGQPGPSADTVGAVEQVDAAELGLVDDLVDLRPQLGDLGLGGLAGGRVVRAGVRGLHGQVAHAAQHVVHLVQGAFSGLHDRDAVLSVAGGLTEATGLGTQALADDEASGVVAGPVDPGARRQLLEGLAHVGCCWPTGCDEALAAITFWLIRMIPYLRVWGLCWSQSVGPARSGQD